MGGAGTDEVCTFLQIRGGGEEKNCSLTVMETGYFVFFYIIAGGGGVV